MNWNPDKKTDISGEESSRSNADRAETADLAVLAALVHRTDPPVVDEDAISDLLADIFHLCDRENVNVEGVIRTAKMNWGAKR